jgi:Domain of unknown function (DUF4304)
MKTLQYPLRTIQNVNDAKQALSTALKQLMRDHDYTKKALTWHKAGAETIRVLNVQQSQWGLQFYINLAIYIRALGSEMLPAESHCHIRMRFNHIVPDASMLEPLLDFESVQNSAISRAEQVAAFVGHYGLPWLEAWADIHYVKAQLTLGRPKGSAILKRVYDHFCLPLPDSRKPPS